jgi:hypothetical protein
MHRSILALAASTALIVSVPVYAQRGHGGGKPTTTPAGSHAPSTATHGSSGTTTHGNSGASTHGNSAATTHGQSGSHGPATKPTSSGSTHGSGNAHGTGSGNTHSTETATTTKKSTSAPAATTTTGSGSTTTLTPVQQKLQQNTKLADKLRNRLPDNTSLMDAAEGFRNLGQFVAAVNVSNNLGLDFTALKTSMVDDGMSLGQAIQNVKKTANVETEVRRAETEADSMIKSTTTSTATTSTSSTSTPSTATTKKAKKTNGTK